MVNLPYLNEAECRQQIKQLPGKIPGRIFLYILNGALF